MQGNPNIIRHLNVVLKNELTAINQYFLHSRMYQDWGFNKLFDRINHEMEEETQHADALLQRILFLESTPDMTPKPMFPGRTVPEMLRADLKLEYEVRAALSKGVQLCETHKDYISRDILILQLQDTEEDHAYWLEQQLGLIDRIGLENYLQSQA